MRDPIGLFDSKFMRRFTAGALIVMFVRGWFGI